MVVMRAWLLLPCFVVACGGETRTQPPPTRTPAKVSYYPTVAKIVQERCVGCHAEGGIAPFALDSYDGVRALGPVLPQVTKSRLMPPWGMDNSGDCNTYDAARWLTDVELDALADWVDTGMAMGDPAQAPAATAPPAGLSSVGGVLDMGVTYTPQGGTDDYRCFVVDPKLTADKFLTAYEVKPGEPRVVHHVVVYQLGSEADARTVRDNDANDPGPGYSCFGGVGADADFIIAWAPGTPATRLAAGTGLRVRGGRPVVLQLHYKVLGGALADRTTIDLELADSVDKEGFMGVSVDTTMRLAPGQAEVPWSFDAAVGADVTVYGLFPHMHTLGKTMTIEVERAGGNRECMARVHRWDFNWQQFYDFSAPIRLKDGDSVNISCTYDTTSRTGTTRFGERTSDEMCVAVSYYTLD